MLDDAALARALADVASGLRVRDAEDLLEPLLEADPRGAGVVPVAVFRDVFLRDWRATMISALAIPLSAIPSFWFMDMMGFTLNGISLLALSLVAGVLAGIVLAAGSSAPGFAFVGAAGLGSVYGAVWAVLMAAGIAADPDSL